MLTTHHNHHNPRRVATSPAATGATASYTTTTAASSSSTGSVPRSLATPRTSSDRGTTKSSSSEAPRISFTDEAQACYNLLLLIRNDTQALITLRNDNLAKLEWSQSREAPHHASDGGEGEGKDEDGKSGDGSDTDRSLLLAAVNEAITFATRTTAELGPFLERHRWPAGGAPQQQQQRSSLAAIVRPPKILLLRRRRTSSLSSSSSTSSSAAAAAAAPTSDPSARPPAAAADAGDPSASAAPSAELLFSWTLALTELHSAVLAATARLKGYLEFGAAAVGVSEEDRRRREGRASWWAQGRGEFENVELIQSLLGRPRRKWGVGAGVTTAQADEGGGGDAMAALAALVASGVKADEPPGEGGGGHEKERQQEDQGKDDDDNGPLAVLTPVLEDDDTRSEAWTPETMTSPPSTIKSARGDLTARPKQQQQQQQHRRKNSLQHDSPFAVRRSVTEPWSPSSPASGSPAGGGLRELHMARSETFGQAASKTKDHPPRLPSISTTQPSSLNTIQRRLTQALAGAYQGHQRPPTGSTAPRTASSPAALLAPPLLPDAGQEQQLPMRPSSSPGLEAVPETPYTPETPLDPHLAALIAQGALPSKTFQPVIEALGHMIEAPVVSPVSPPGSPQKHQAGVAALNVPSLLRSPQARESIHPVIEGGEPPPQQQQKQQQEEEREQQQGFFVSPVESQEPRTAVTVSPMGSQHPRLSMPLPPLPPPSGHLDGDGGRAAAAAAGAAGDEHWPFLLYMARKQAVSAARWPLGRSQASGGEPQESGGGR